MHDTWTSWWEVTGAWEKAVAAAVALIVALELIILAVWPDWAQARKTFLYIIVGYFVLSGDYYRCKWRMFEPLTDFGAAMGHHLHTYGDLLLEKNGDHYKVTPLTHGSRDD